MTRQVNGHQLDGEPPWDDLDPGIREVVRVLWAKGAQPWSSCQGGPGHLKPKAFVCVVPLESGLEPTATLCLNALQGFGDRYEVQGGMTGMPEFPHQVVVEFEGHFDDEGVLHGEE